MEFEDFVEALLDLRTLKQQGYALGVRISVIVEAKLTHRRDVKHQTLLVTFKNNG